MGQDLFKYLPSEIILNILSRLPTKSAMSCKCVCKPWLDLLETPEFVKSHISKSVPGLVIKCLMRRRPCEIFEFLDERNMNIVLNFDLPFHEPLHSSVNGLLFLCRQDDLPHHTLLCNPITRDYIKLPCAGDPSSKSAYRIQSYGFGVSRITGQYKVVRIFIEKGSRPFRHDQYECQVYTVGTGSWRKISCGEPLVYESRIVGAFLNGNLHWLAFKLQSNSPHQISCLDLETELFSTFSTPRLYDYPWSSFLSVLGDCLCLCDNLSYFNRPDIEIDIWLMKDYGDEKSWTKDFIIRIADMDNYFGYICPIKVSKDGDILMVWRGKKLLYYSSQTNTIEEAPGFDLDSTSIFAPSFLSLKTFAMENVSSF